MLNIPGASVAGPHLHDSSNEAVMIIQAGPLNLSLLTEKG